jgi:2-polyprenyl-6-methoxyphenol hydroxylase-like FAD-dependent oxidoreductase
MESSPHTKSFRVIIAGGGISGLALANCLELANIDYLLLEGRDSLTPFIGAGVCLSSGSGPVLDQLGVRQKIFDRIAPLRYFGLHSPDGDYLDAPLTGMLLNQTR